MDCLSYELLVDVLHYVKLNDIPCTTTKKIFYLRRFLQIITEDYEIENDRLCRVVTVSDKETKKSLGKVRTKKIIFSTAGDMFSNTISPIFDNYKYNYDCLEMHKLFKIEKFPATLKTLIIYAGKNHEFRVPVPKNLQKLIIPNMYLDDYPENLTVLVCSRKPDSTLNKLKKLCITKQDKYSRYIFPENLIVLSITTTEIVTNEKLLAMSPKGLKKIIIETKDGDNIRQVLISSTKTYQCNRLYVYTNNFLNAYLKEIKTFKILNLSIKTYYFTKENMDIIVKSFDDLESLYITSSFIDPIDAFPSKLKKIKFKCVMKDTLVKTINFTNFPDSLIYLSITKIYAPIPQTFKLPPNLIYLSLITHSVCNVKLILPKTLKTLILDLKIQNLGEYPTDLVYLDVKTDDAESLLSIRYLTKLKYLILEENCNIIVVEYPRSLKYLRKNVRDNNIIPKHIYTVSWMLSNLKYQKYGDTELVHNFNVVNNYGYLNTFNPNINHMIFYNNNNATFYNNIYVNSANFGFQN
jgi:hypothetical protein